MREPETVLPVVLSKTMGVVPAVSLRMGEEECVPSMKGNVIQLSRGQIASGQRHPRVGSLSTSKATLT